MTCREAGDDRNHARRPAGEDGYCTSCRRARKVRKRAAQRAGSQRRNFGMEPADIAALESYQRAQNRRRGLSGTCAGCGVATGASKALATDHNHRHCSGAQGCRECVRGRLCGPCNRVLGHFRDDPARLIALAYYLIDPPWPRVRDGLNLGDSSSSEPDGKTTDAPP